ncbi:MAG TPA: hypothetical protein VGH83_05585 [Candidatus Acidoferrum sp.]|jgi:hypothetical protein
MPKPPGKPPKPPKPPKPQPPTDLLTNKILLDILKAVNEGVKVEKAQLDVAVDQLQTASEQLRVAGDQLEVSRGQLAVARDQLGVTRQQFAVEKAQLITATESLDVLREILASISPPPTHRYTVTVRAVPFIYDFPSGEIRPGMKVTVLTKEKPMAVQPGKGAAFGALMEDNGNPIELPAGSSWSWHTDDDTDTIVLVSSDNTALVVITTTDPPADGRDTLVATASATDPSGEEIEGSLTTELVPGVGHTYTVRVFQPVPQPIGGKR